MDGAWPLDLTVLEFRQPEGAKSLLLYSGGAAGVSD